MFAIHLGGAQHKSHVTFGGYNSKVLFGGEKSLSYVPMTQNGLW